MASSRGALVPTELDGFSQWTVRAAQARSRVVEPVIAALAAIDNDDVEGSLRRLESTAKEDFELITAVAVGAYTMHPDVMAAVGYPIPERAPVPFDQFANEISSGILEPVTGADRALLREVADSTRVQHAGLQ